MCKIHITGASGSGTTTLGQALSAKLHIPYFDSDNFLWRPSEPPYQHMREKENRTELLRQTLTGDKWVLSGSAVSWGDVVLLDADLIVLLILPDDIRMARIKAREKARFGKRIEEGGDMWAAHRKFVAWASRYSNSEFEGRSLKLHREWIAKMGRPYLELCAVPSVDKLVQAVMKCAQEG